MYGIEVINASMKIDCFLQISRSPIENFTKLCHKCETVFGLSGQRRNPNMSTTGYIYN